MSELKHDGKQYQLVKPDSRYIIINGSPVEDMYQFYGVRNAESVNVLTPTQPVKRYGKEKEKNGAVEINGFAITFVPALLGALPPHTVRLEINRNKGDLLIIPNTENDTKTLTVYNSQGKVIYNSTNYEDNWDGKIGNYKEFLKKK